MLLLVSLQDTTRGDDLIREILVQLEDLTQYSDLFTYDTNTMPNLQMTNSEFCNCKELIVQQLLNTLALARTTDGGIGLGLRENITMLQYNIESLIQSSGTDGRWCSRDKMIMLKNERLDFVNLCIEFFKTWMRKMCE